MKALLCINLLRTKLILRFPVSRERVEILAPKIIKPNVTREKLPKSCQKAAKKLPKRLTYEKGAGKTLMKLTLG